MASRWFRCLVIVPVLAALCGVLALGTAAAPVTIKVWLRGFSDFHDPVVADFQKKYPDIKLDLSCVPGDGYRDKILAAVASGDVPDVFEQHTADMPGYYEQGACEPLDAYIAKMKDADKVDEAAYGPYTFEGAVYAFPVSSYALALFVRKDWLDKLGLALPKTWDDFYKVAEAFTKKDPDGNGKADTYGYAENWSTKEGFLGWKIMPWVYQAGGSFSEKRKGKWVPTFQEAGGVKAVKFWKRCWDGGVIPKTALTNDYTQNFETFLNGQTGMAVDGDWWISDVKKTLAGKAITAALPSDKKAATVGGGNCFILYSRSKKKQEAFKFLEWWASKETQEVMLLGWDRKLGGEKENAGTFNVTIRKDLDPVEILEEPLLRGFVQMAPYALPEGANPDFIATREIYAKAVVEAITGQKTVEDALNGAAKEVEPMMQ